MIDYQRALQSLVPDAEFKGTVKDNTREQFETIEWVDARKQPTIAELEAEDARLVAQEKDTSSDWYKANYERLRAAAYSPVGDQLDAIWKALNQLQLDGIANLPSDTDLELGRWLQVKQTYPKPPEAAE